MNREDFPVLKQDIVYFDNGATTLKPQCVIDKMVDYYSTYTSNIHRGEYSLAIKTNQEYDGVRNIVKKFIGAENENEIVFTKGSTEALNMIVFGFFKNQLKEGDEVLINKGEHASNVLPWYILQKTLKIKVKSVALSDQYELKLDHIKNAITDKTKVVAVSHISNVVGDVRDVHGIGELCHEKGIYFVVDASQAVSHVPIHVCQDYIDFLAFSGHKMMGPTGVGVLYGRYELLDMMDPLEYGGGMNQLFEEDGSYELKSPPSKFEAGTPPIAEVIGLGEAIKYIESIGVDKIHEHEVMLKKYLVSQIEDIDNVILYNKDSESGIVIFNLDRVFSQDTAVYLNHYNICIRAGNHCTKMLKDDLGINNTCRVSMYLYNTREDVDRLVKALKDSHNIFKIII